MGLHALLVVVVTGCLLAGRWQLHSALGGNTLSWAYTVEWPVFAVIGVIAWWHLIHEDPEQRAERAERAAAQAERQAKAAREAQMAAALRAELDGRPSSTRSWRQAAAEIHEVDDVPEVDEERVAAAARREYEAHLQKVSARDSVWLDPRASR